MIFGIQTIQWYLRFKPPHRGEFVHEEIDCSVVVSLPSDSMQGQRNTKQGGCGLETPSRLGHLLGAKWKGRWQHRSSQLVGFQMGTKSFGGAGKCLIRNEYIASSHSMMWWSKYPTLSVQFWHQSTIIIHIAHHIAPRECDSPLPSHRYPGTGTHLAIATMRVTRHLGLTIRIRRWSLFVLDLDHPSGRTAGIVCTLHTGDFRAGALRARTDFGHAHAHRCNHAPDVCTSRRLQLYIYTLCAHLIHCSLLARRRIKGHRGEWLIKIRTWISSTYVT